MECEVQAREIRPWAVLIVLSVAELAATYETVMVFVALPKLFRIFQEPVAVTWLVTAYLIVSAGILLIASRLGDLFGRTRVLTWVLLLATCGSILSAITDSLVVMIVGRAIQGVAGAVLPLALGIVRETLPKERIGQGVGILTGVASIGAGLGLLVGALLIDNFPWHSIFIFAAVTSVASALLVFLVLPRNSGQPDALKDFDVWGGLLPAPAIAGLTYGLSRFVEMVSGDLPTIVIFIVSALMFAIWVRHELRCDNPLINLRLLTVRQIAIGNILMALAGIAFFQQTQLMTIFLQQPIITGVGLGLTATIAGAFKLAGNFAGMLGGALGSFVSPRYGAGATSFLAGLALIAGWGWLILYHDTVTDIAVGLVLTGFGMVALYAGAATAVLEVAPPGRYAEVSGLMAVVRAICLAIGSQMIAVSLAKSTVSIDGNVYADETSYIFTFGWIAMCAVLCIYLSIMLMRLHVRGPSAITT